MPLRTLLRSSAALLSLLGVAASVALYITADSMERNGWLLLDSVEGVRAAEQLDVSILTLSRARQMVDSDPRGAPVAAKHAEEDARRALKTFGPYISTDKERQLVEQVNKDVTSYLNGQGESQEVRARRLRSALQATRELVDLNVAQAQEVRALNDTADRLGKTVAVVLAAALVTASLLFVLALRPTVERPLANLRRSLSRFKGGDREERLPVEGPEELRQIAAEFNELADSLARRDRLQLEFLAGVAHDLRGPLNVLKLSAQSIATAPALPPEERIRASLGRVSAQVDRLARLVDDLLDRTRIEAGNLDLHLDVCDVRALVMEVADLHRAATDRHHLEVRVPPGPVLVRGDGTRLVQVLTNLVSNALKYSPGGGAIHIALEGSGEEVQISVSDEGIGIPLEDQERIFEPFHRGAASAMKIPGVGLGLSVARRLTQAHGGRIEVKSLPGAGSTFVVHLPVSGPPDLAAGDGGGVGGREAPLRD
ncbi:MAG TPA: HAMP domain-containing sensor histidine kinase [Myxococcales bacterium]|nr:HAMP domain-containing sensor histidine kinase [Myxococcales bacterium]